MIPGWPYSVIAALEPGRTSWTAVLDAVRLGPDDDETEVTAVQVREVVTRLIAAGHWREGDLRILVVFDAGVRRDPAGLAAGGPAGGAAGPAAQRPGDVAARAAAPARDQRPAPQARPRAGAVRPGGLPGPAGHHQHGDLPVRDGRAAAWDRVHPRLTHRAAWLDHDGDLPVIEGTLIRLQVDYLPGDRDPKPVWLWWSRTGAAPAEVDRCWQSFLRRFDLEHTFRLFKQVLGWTAPKIRDPAAADRWTWLIIACLRPAAPGPPAGRRPAPPLGTARPAGPADPGPGPPRVPEHPREGPLPSRCTETRQARPGQAARVEEPPPGATPRRGKNDEEGTHAQGTTRTRRLNDKLRACLETQ